ncbi:hypothetical protein MZA92_02170 [Haemophilus influenzae]
MGCIFGSGSCEFACGDTDLADDLSMMIQIDWSAIKDVGKNQRAYF